MKYGHDDPHNPKDLLDNGFELRLTRQMKRKLVREIQRGTSPLQMRLYLERMRYQQARRLKKNMAFAMMYGMGVHRVIEMYGNNVQQLPKEKE